MTDVFCDITAFFTCPACGRHAACDLHLAAPSVGSVPSHRQWPARKVVLDCEHCRATFEAWVDWAGMTVTIALDAFPDVEIVVREAAPTSTSSIRALLTRLPPDPHAVFLEALDQALDLLHLHGTKDGGSVVNRIVFCRLVDATEAYIADTLMIYVADDKDALARLVANEQALRERAFSLTQIAERADIVRDEVVTYLDRLDYGRPADIERIYKTAFDVEFFADRDELATMTEVVSYRRCCVHRNGVDRTGRPLTVFTPAYLAETAARMRRIVDRVESVLSPF